MVHISSLPVEIIIKIMELSVEDAIAIEDESLSREILMNLSLISIKYAFIAQEILWRYLELGENAMTDSLFLSLIEKGFGKNMYVDTLAVRLSYFMERIEGMNVKAEMEKVTLAVNGVASIENFIVGIVSAGIQPPLLHLPAVFGLPSLSNLTTLDLQDVKLDPLDTILPSTLKHLTFIGRSREDFEPFFLALLSSHLVLDDLKLGLASFSDEPDLPWPAIIDWFRIGGSSLKIVDFGSLDLEQCALLLPFLPSIKSILINSRDHLTSGRFLQHLLPAVRLQSLESGVHDLDETGHLTPVYYISSLILLPQLSHLKVLRIIPTDYNEGPEFEQRILSDKVKELKMKNWVDACQEKGIRLSFWSLEDETVYKEKQKQKYYKRRRLAYRTLYRVRI